MRRKALALGAGVVMAATVAVPALADYRCFGSNNTLIVCADPQGEMVIDDCVHAGQPPCTPLQVYGPSYYCAGRSGEVCDLNAIGPQQ